MRLIDFHSTEIDDLLKKLKACRDENERLRRELEELKKERVKIEKD